MTEAAKFDITVELLPPIPDKRYFAIGEVSGLCAVKPHVLRYWEQEFTQLRPTKRRGNRRYYQREDVEMVRQIRRLLYEEGFTIPGARQRLRDAGRGPSVDGLDTAAIGAAANSDLRNALAELRQELEAVLALLQR